MTKKELLWYPKKRRNVFYRSALCRKYKTRSLFFDGKSFFKDGEQVYIHLSTDFPDFVGVLHRHQFIEAVYILSGEAVHTVGTRQYKVKCGDVTLINSEVPHKFTPIEGEGKEKFVAYDLMFTTDFFGASSIKMKSFESLKNSYLFYSLFPSESYEQPDMCIFGKHYSDYGEIFTRIYHEYIQKEKGYIELIRVYVIELIIKMFRDIEKEGNVELSPDKKELVRKDVKYIEENYNEPLSLGFLAAQVFLSPDYFRKLFKKATGYSVATFQQKLRIDKACRLLKTTDTPIKDICADVGYQDMTSFYQVFKKQTGKTPNQYRFDK